MAVLALERSAIRSAVFVSGSARPATQMQTTAYVVSHVTQALDAMPVGTILFDRTMYVPPGQGPGYYPTDTWASYGRTRSEIFTQAGQLVSDYGNAITRTTREAVQVDYQNKTWWRSVGSGRRISRRPVQFKWTCSNSQPTDIIGDPSDMVAQLRTALSCGELKAVGTGTVDGVTAVNLAGNAGGDAVTYWVNATTYLPVRVTTIWYGKPPVMQDDLQWLLPTAANLAKLNVPIPPAGFTRVPPPTLHSRKS